MTIFAFIFISLSDSSYDDRGEWIFIFKTDIVISDDRKDIEQIATIDPNGIIFSFGCSCDGQ